MNLDKTSIQFVFNTADKSVSIVTTDNASGLDLCESKVYAEEFFNALAGESVACNTTISDQLWKLNKQEQSKAIEFEIPFGIGAVMDNLEYIKTLAEKATPNGWAAHHNYPMSAFFSKGGKMHAKIIVSKWE